MIMKTIRLLPVFCLVLVSSAYAAPKERKLNQQMVQLKNELTIEARKKRGNEKVEAEAQIAIVSEYLGSGIVTKRQLIEKYKALQSTSAFMFSQLPFMGGLGGFGDIQNSVFTNLGAQMAVIEKLVPNIRQIAPPSFGVGGLGSPTGLPAFGYLAYVYDGKEFKPNPYLPGSGYGVGVGGFGFPPAMSAPAEKN